MSRQPKRCAPKAPQGRSGLSNRNIPTLVAVGILLLCLMGGLLSTCLQEQEPPTTPQKTLPQKTQKKIAAPRQLPPVAQPEPQPVNEPAPLPEPEPQDEPEIEPEPTPPAMVEPPDEPDIEPEADHTPEPQQETPPEPEAKAEEEIAIDMVTRTLVFTPDADQNNKSLEFYIQMVKGFYQGEEYDQGPAQRGENRKPH